MINDELDKAIINYLEQGRLVAETEDEFRRFMDEYNLTLPPLPLQNDTAHD